MQNDGSRAQYLYYRSTAQEASLSDDRLVALIGDIYDEFPGYGYRRVTLELCHRDYKVNHKRLARVMRERHLGVRHKRRFVRTTDSNHSNPVFPDLYRNRRSKFLGQRIFKPATLFATSRGCSR